VPSSGKAAGKGASPGIVDQYSSLPSIRLARARQSYYNSRVRRSVIVLLNYMYSVAFFSTSVVIVRLI